MLAEYAKAFGRAADGIPTLTSANSPLASLANYPIDYENPRGAHRIAIKGLLP